MWKHCKWQITSGDKHESTKYIYKNTNTLIHIYTHIQMHHLVSKPNFSQQHLQDTKQQQTALWMNCDKVLFFSPLPLSSVFREH